MTEPNSTETKEGGKDKEDKNIFSLELKQIEYTTIEDALEKCREYLKIHQKSIEGKEIISNILYLNGYSFVH